MAREGEGRRKFGLIKKESLSFSLVGEGRAKKEQNVNFSFKVRKRKVLRDRKRERNEGK